MSTISMDQYIVQLRGEIDQHGHTIKCLRGELKALRAAKKLPGMPVVRDVLRESLHYSAQDPAPSEELRAAVNAVLGLIGGGT